ncbi:MAG: hypothetical protein LBV43_05260 [Prevotella sp.]|jgi:hypothetical protein|nr:hypothetical protein [Prevotella sp.]
MKIKISPLDELRKEKELAKIECEASEVVLAEQWAYLGDHAVSLVFNSILHGVTDKLGFGSKEQSKSQKVIGSGGGGFLNNITSNLGAYYPLLWDLLRPVLWAFAVKKVKSIFTGKKKK